MNWVLFEYPRCTTCKRAKAFLDKQEFPVEVRHIVEEPPSVEDLRTWIEASRLPWKKFFNTSGMKYRALGLKDVLAKDIPLDEVVGILASDGMLIKRPLLVDKENPQNILLGFKEEEWQALFNRLQ